MFLQEIIYDKQEYTNMRTQAKSCKHRLRELSLIHKLSRQERRNWRRVKTRPLKFGGITQSDKQRRL